MLKQHRTGWSLHRARLARGLSYGLQGLGFGVWAAPHKRLLHAVGVMQGGTGDLIQRGCV